MTRGISLCWFVICLIALSWRRWTCYPTKRKIRAHQTTTRWRTRCKVRFSSFRVLTSSLASDNKLLIRWTSWNMESNVCGDPEASDQRSVSIFVDERWTGFGGFFTAIGGKIYPRKWWWNPPLGIENGFCFVGDLIRNSGVVKAQK